MKYLICIFVAVFIYLKIRYRPKTNNILSIYFGVPGAGKSTVAAWLTKKDIKKGRNVWSNVPITGANQLDPQADIGKVMICDGRVIIDEAGIEYNNRDFKKFSADSTYFFKYHRHYQLDVDMFSQGWDDCDKKIRTLAQRYYVLGKSFFPCLIYSRRIGKKIGINDMTKEICDEYYFVPFGRRYYFAPAVWHMFNTLSRKEFELKNWEVW